MKDMRLTKFLIESISNLRIAVIGDVMLDCYFYGEVNRISPEAPVPIVQVNDVKYALGGATNVAANLANLGCNVFMGGVVGDDKHYTTVQNMLNELAIDISGLVISDERDTITKLRVIGGKQQMLRLDFENIGDLYPQETEKLQSWLNNLLENGLDGIVISDYAKGVCSTQFCEWVIAMAHKFNVPVLVDPKGNNWKKYTGCDFITPNLKELGEAIGSVVNNEDIAVVDMAHIAKDKFAIKNMIVTRSEKGMSLINDKEVFHNPAVAMEVYDVSGAGDTVAATLIASVAGGLELKRAIYLANRAAGIVVAKVGTYPVHREELLKDLFDIV